MQNPPISYYSAFDNKPFPKEQYFDHAEPFWLRTKSASAVVICLHGFGATTYESRPIGEGIFSYGIDAAGFLLPGHGYKDSSVAKKAMGAINRDTWLQATKNEIAEARKHYSKVFLYGQSLGGVIALIMASEGLVDGIAVTAPALKLPKGTGLAATLLGFLNLNVNITANPPFFNECYQFTNLRALRELHRIALFGRQCLTKIQCKIQHFHSHNDHVVDSIVATWIFNAAHQVYGLSWYDESGHTMPLDKNAEQIKADIGQYFRNLVDGVRGL